MQLWLDLIKSCFFDICINSGSFLLMSHIHQWLIYAQQEMRKHDHNWLDMHRSEWKLINGQVKRGRAWQRQRGNNFIKSLFKANAVTSTPFYSLFWKCITLPQALSWSEHLLNNEIFIELNCSSLFIYLWLLLHGVIWRSLNFNLNLAYSTTFVVTNTLYISNWFTAITASEIRLHIQFFVHQLN